MTTLTETPRTGWGYGEGEPIVAGLRAWAPLGGGRRCETWLAWSTERWSPVVVKLPRPGLLDDPNTRADLTHEVAMMGRLTHPGVQRLYEARLDAEVPYLVAEYVEGPTLGALLAAEGPLEADEVVLLGIQIAMALRYLHCEGVVHLDVKPSNVCLRDGRPVLIDFGIARHIGTRRRPGAPRGSPPYMAPEQCREEPATPATDLFALGALLFEAATGEHAFHPRRVGSGWWYPQMQDRPPTLMSPTGGLVGRLMEPDAARRPADAATVIRLLSALLPVGEEPWPAWVEPHGG